MNGTTYTYAILDVSPTTYKEIRDKLEAAGYGHAFHLESVIGSGRLRAEIIDMHGIALRAET